MDYSIFPYWMGINNFGELIAGIICCILLFCIYILFGYVFCPNDLKTQWIRVICILTWPLFIVVGILGVPFMLLYEFSKPPEVQDKELKEFIKENC